MRIAIVGYAPIYPRSNGYEQLLFAIASLMLKHKNDVKVFTLGEKDANIKLGDYTERVIKNEIIVGKGTGARRIYDLLILGGLGYRPSVEKMNKNRKLLSELDKFNPALIFIGDFNLVDMLDNYKQSHTNVRIIAQSDSYNLIENSFSSIEKLYRSSKFGSAIKNSAKIFLKNNYLKYYMEKFEKMLEISDIVIVPSQMDKKEVDRKFAAYSKKVVVLPLVLISRRESKSRPKNIATVKKIKRALFLGAYNYWPNREAMAIIEKDVAPRVPEVEFIIQGAGCPKVKKGNVKYVGEYSIEKLDELIAKCDACIAPMIQHTSIKTKMMEYFLSGKPIIGTTEAFYGYPAKNRTNAMIEDDPKNLYNCFKELNSNPKLIAKIQKNMKKVVESMSPKRISSKLIKIIEM